MPKTQINLEGWQDYRGNMAGSLLYVETSHQSEMPVRDQLNENEKGFLYEPNYETSTYGLMSCYNVKAINTIVKSKSRYILFGTRYEGLSDSEMRNKYLIMGYMRIDKIKDVRTRHVQRYMANPEMHADGTQLGCLRSDAFCLPRRFFRCDGRDPQGMGLQGPCFPSAQDRVLQGTPRKDSRSPGFQAGHD